MEKKADYTVVGIFVVVLTVCLVAFFFWLTAKRSDVDYVTYAIYTNEDVTGLSEQSPVRFNGVGVGFVSSISLDKSNPRLVLIRMEVEKGTPITTSTYAILKSQGITGLVYVSLKAGLQEGVQLRPKPGSPYAVIPVQKSLLARLTNVIPAVSSSVSSAAKVIQRLFSTKNRIYMEQSLQNVAHFTSQLSLSSKALSSSIQNLNKTLSNAAVASKRLPKVMSQLQDSMKQIGAAAKGINATSRAVSKTAKSSRILINNLNQQSLPDLHRAMSSFSVALDKVGRLSSQLRQNPAQLVRGRTAPQPGPGEK